MDDFDLYLDTYLTIYSYRSTKNSLHIVKDRPKGRGRFSIIIIINNNKQYDRKSVKSVLVLAEQ